jgi:hypothetical protein
MSTTLQQISNDALGDLGILWQGQNSTDAVFQGCLRQMNILLDEWALGRNFINTTPDGGVTWPKLSAFPDLVTPYIFGPGQLRLLRAGLAVAIIPMMTMYFKIEAPKIQEIGAAYEKALSDLNGIGIPGVV